jgi:protein gp37
MAENSKIEWTDHTFNPWEGCQKVGPGCDHCYAEARNARFGGGAAVNWGPGAPRRRTSAANWRKPLAWDKAHAAFFAEHGRRQRVFCASLADVFDNEVDPMWRADLFALIQKTPNLDWLLLTKRIGNAARMIDDAAAELEQWPVEWLTTGRLVIPNVWLGATIVNRDELLRDAQKLAAVPARVHFWSVEPMLADLGEVPRGLMPDWVICGGESGHKARPTHPDWVRSLRDQCAAAGVPFLFKQWGEFLPASANANDPGLADVPDSRIFWSDGEKWDRFDGRRANVDLVARVGKSVAGRLLDGVEHNGFPAEAATGATA